MSIKNKNIKPGPIIDIAGMSVVFKANFLKKSFFFACKRTPYHLFQNNQIAPNKISFRKTINIISMSLLAPFIVQNNPYS